MKGNIKEYLKSGFYKGVGITLGFFTTSLVAAAAAMNLFAPGEVISSARINQNFLIAAPEYAIVAFNLANCPEGWTAADGTNGTPDLRGIFVRGKDDMGTPAGAAGLDVPRVLGHYQEDSFQGHYHQVTGISSSVMQQNPWSGSGTALVGSDAVTVGNPINGANGPVRFGDETRPKNRALLYCMRKN
ncbi:MAG: phage tail protein [Leptospira bouyouniensis]